MICCNEVCNMYVINVRSFQTMKISRTQACVLPCNAYRVLNRPLTLANDGLAFAFIIHNILTLSLSPSLSHPWMVAEGMQRTYVLTHNARVTSAVCVWFKFGHGWMNSIKCLKSVFLVRIVDYFFHQFFVLARAFGWRASVRWFVLNCATVGFHDGLFNPPCTIRAFSTFHTLKLNWPRVYLSIRKKLQLPH